MSDPSLQPIANAQVIVPDWPAPAHVQALFTTRTGGCSAAPWDSWNLGSHVGDDRQAVMANRARLHMAVQALGGGAHPVRLTFLTQVHGNHVVHLPLAPLDLPHGPSTDGPPADAAITTSAGTACTILVADCLPVLFTHRHYPIVAAAHAGWRGLAGTQGHGILEATLQQLALLARLLAGAPHMPLSAVARDVLVWLGPCIGPAAFEVGDDVREAFVRPHPADAAVAACFSPAGPGKWHASLPALARLRLHAAGVPHQAMHGNDGQPAWCTHAQAQHFFSHRRDAAALGATGRMAACIWLT
ncbi:hypothetical protein AAV94_02870 [Lampropedia cohaerens]|uniref:Purine nucleoside phosphorylase n=1 Tax=Lampropedia cohaerens TaxID=1610491 RepID=A0A0U1Q295_9BURK|nr:polyphenol oxidase family protein [Lampropedia cohaerens]KKW68883.1 hypothetical protein AAV94_02870 [Lampropedia cohaerens]